jgi:hypothetical protein
MREVYGRLYPKTAYQIQVEIDCYRDAWPVEKGGLGREGHFRNAFKLVWPKYEWNEWVDLMIWAFCNYKISAVIGHERASKTFTCGHLAYLDYVCEPTKTLTSIATVTFEGLKLRMWSDILQAIETAQIPCPFTIRSTTNECRVFPTEAKGDAGEKWQIHGMAVTRTQDAPGRIRGGHAERRRIWLDEAQDMPDVIYDAMINPLSAPDARAMFLSNPVEKVSRFGDWCEPVGGWGSVDETDKHWETKKGGICLHFDGLQSANMRAGRTIFPYMLRQENIDDIEKAHGKDSVQWWALVRGWFPPDGVVAKMFPASVLEKAKPPIIFEFAPQMCASLDPAFEFDTCAMQFGQLGMPIFGTRQYKINCTETLVCKIDVGTSSEPKDYQVAHWVMAECKRRGVLSQHFIMDCTGGGRGVLAILQKEWSRDVRWINYGGASTDRPLRGDDNRKCNEIYQWFVTELWGRASECCRAGLIGGLCNLDPRTTDDLSTRRYAIKQGTKGSLMVAETKKEVKARLGRSPDFGDAFVQFGELLIQLGTIPGGGMGAKLAAGHLWTRARERAKRANAVYSDEKAYAY